MVIEVCKESGGLIESHFMLMVMEVVPTFSREQEYYKFVTFLQVSFIYFKLINQVLFVTHHYNI